MTPEVPARRVLVRCVNWLGDLVMTLPALRALRVAYPDAHLALLVRADLAAFFDGARWVDEVLPFRFSSGWRGLRERVRLARQLRRERFDLAVLFPRSFESALLPALARVPVRVGYRADARTPLLTRSARYTPQAWSWHQSRDHLYLLEQTLGISAPSDPVVPDVAAPHVARMREWLGARRRRPAGPLVALAVAAAYGPAKQWPAERYGALVDRLGERWGAECVLVGAPSEKAVCERVLAASRQGALVAAGETGVGEALALLSLCDGFAGNDSGSMHVAAALGIPTVGIFGSTNPDRTGPRGGRAVVLYRRIECSPCMERTCRFGHYECLQRIAVDDVVAALESAGAFSPRGSRTASF